MNGVSGLGRSRFWLASAAVLLAAALGIAAAPARAIEAPTHGEVQRALQRIVDGGAPGATAVIQGPNGTERFAAGYADLRRSVPLSPRDRGRIGSVTKSFTATVVLQLVAAGKVGLDDTVEQWLPGMVPNGGQISVRELLNMSSGLPDYCGVPPDSQLCTPPPSEFTRSWTPTELVAIGVSAPPNFPPGQGWSYTNTGFQLLGMIVEQASGKSLAANYQSRIIGPLGLHATSFPSTSVLPGRFSHGYEPKQGSTWPEDVTATSPTIAGAAGGIVSTPGDMARFMRALRAGKLLPPGVMRQMERPTPLSLAGPTAFEGGGVGSYGLGLVHYTWSASCGVWGHTGDFPGFHTIALSTADGTRGAAMYVNADALAAPGALADLQAEHLLGCRMRFGR